MVSQQELNELFEYKDGMVFWKVKMHRSMIVGQRAGCLNRSNGYRLVKIKKVLEREHRVIWVMHNGQIPEGMVLDHIDNNRQNNDICNLRLATLAQNSHNTKVHKDNLCGSKGVDWHKASQTFRVRVVSRGKCEYKHYRSLEAAKIGHQQLVAQMHGEFANLG